MLDRLRDVLRKSINNAPFVVGNNSKHEVCIFDKRSNTIIIPNINFDEAEDKVEKLNDEWIIKQVCREIYNISNDTNKPLITVVMQGSGLI